MTDERQVEVRRTLLAFVVDSGAGDRWVHWMDALNDYPSRPRSDKTNTAFSSRTLTKIPETASAKGIGRSNNPISISN